MNIGSFNIKIAIQSPPATKNAGGELTGAWTNVHVLKAARQIRSASERMVRGQDVTTTQMVFRIHFRTGISENMRIYEYDTGDYYEITGMIPKDKQYIDIYARKNDN